MVRQLILASAAAALLAPVAPAAGSAPVTASGDDQLTEAQHGFVISGRHVRLRDRIARIRVSCRAPRGCSGTLALKARTVVGAGDRRRTRHVNVAKRRFDIPSRRRNAVLAVRLTSSGVRMVRAQPRLRILAVASVHFADGDRAKPSERFWLYRPRAARR